MIQSDANSGPADRLGDEIEQLRTSLESALDENARLADDRDRLLRRVTTLSRDLQALRENAVPSSAQPAQAVPVLQYSQAEEELRVAFEELQVLTEELEVANTGLQEVNLELDARVEERTAQLTEVNEALQSTGRSLRMIADLVPDLLLRADRFGNANWFNQRWFDYSGQMPGEALDLGWLDTVHPVDASAALAAWQNAVASGTPFERELRLTDSRGDGHWFLLRAEPLRNENGQILEWFGTGTDINERRVAGDALQQSELRFRTLIEGMPQLVWRAVGKGFWTWSSPQWTAYTGQSDMESRAMGWLQVFHPDDREAATDAWDRAQQSGLLEIEGRIFNASESRYRHFRTRALPVRDAGGDITEWLGTSTDVDDITQLQHEQGVLVGELQHRTRNLMDIVQAIISRTLKRSASFEEFQACIQDRMQALARVQGLLSRRESGTRVAFDVLMREELKAHTDIDDHGRGEHVSMQGPKGIQLRSATVQTLALALHELTTNAVKYGALSRPGGHLRITWEVRRAAEEEPRLFVDWRETGVAPPADNVEAPVGGYGRELIEKALPYQLRARTTYTHEAEGIHCTIDVAVPADTSQE